MMAGDRHKVRIDYATYRSEDLAKDFIPEGVLANQHILAQAQSENDTVRARARPAFVDFDVPQALRCASYAVQVRFLFAR